MQRDEERPHSPATVDREIVIARDISAPPRALFEAFTEVRHLSRWWGPEEEFTTTTSAFEFASAASGTSCCTDRAGRDYQESHPGKAPPRWSGIASLHGEFRGDPTPSDAS